MSNRQTTTDVILIGAGIMSATLGSLLKKLVPDWEITVFERLANAGEESSNEWNNAGTGHAALCELNYTVEKSDGSNTNRACIEPYRTVRLRTELAETVRPVSGDKSWH